MNGAAVRKAFEEGASRMEETIAASRRIALVESDSLGNGLRGGGLRILVRVIH